MLIAAVAISCSPFGSGEVAPPPALPALAPVEVEEAPVDTSAPGSLLEYPDFERLVDSFLQTPASVPIAGSSERLLPEGYSREAEAALRNGTAGVWCAGTAEFLAGQLSSSYPTAVVHYGPHPAAGHPDGLLTHAITLVRVGGGWYALDAYLGIIYPDPLHTWIDRVGIEPTSHISYPVEKAVVYSPGDYAERVVSQHWGWLRGRFNDAALSDCSPESDGGPVVCRRWIDSADLVSLHCKARPSLDFVASDGFAPDLTSLMAYPYGVFDGESWSWVSDWPEVRRILDVIDEKYRS